MIDQRGGKADHRAWLPAAAVVGVLLAVVLSLNARQPKWESLPPVETPAPSAFASARPAPSASASAAPAILFAAPAAPMSLPVFQGPTMEEVENNLKEAYAFRGITSKALLHVMAIDWMQPGYRSAVAEARALADAGRFADAIQLLEQARAAADPDHLTARITLLRTEEEIARKAGRFDMLPELGAQLEELRQQVVTLVMKAAKDGGLPEAEVRAVMGKIENRRKENDTAKRAADWLSGAKLAESDADPTDTTPAPGSAPLPEGY